MYLSNCCSELRAEVHRAVPAELLPHAVRQVRQESGQEDGGGRRTGGGDRDGPRGGGGGG